MTKCVGEMLPFLPGFPSDGWVDASRQEASLQAKASLQVALFQRNTTSNTTGLELAATTTARGEPRASMEAELHKKRLAVARAFSTVLTATDRSRDATKSAEELLTKAGELWQENPCTRCVLIISARYFQVPRFDSIFIAATVSSMAADISDAQGAECDIAEEAARARDDIQQAAKVAAGQTAVLMPVRAELQQLDEAIAAKQIEIKKFQGRVQSVKEQLEHNAETRGVDVHFKRPGPLDKLEDSLQALNGKAMGMEEDGMKLHESGMNVISQSMGQVTKELEQLRGWVTDAAAASATMARTVQSSPAATASLFADAYTASSGTIAHVGETLK